MKIAMIVLALCTFNSANAQSLKTQPTQSIIYDAIEYYCATNGVTFYFRHTRKPEGNISLEVIDLYNQQRVGMLDDIVPETVGATKEKIWWFLSRYNARKQAFTEMDWIEGMVRPSPLPHDSVIVREKSLSILSALRAKYPGNAFNHSADTLLKLTLNARSPFFSLRDSAKVKAFFATYLDDKVLIENVSTDKGGGFAQNLAEGLADFLIERANEELRAAVFRRLITAFENNPELPILFPNIDEFLQNVEQYNFDLAIKTIQARAEKDLENLLSTVPKLSRLDKYKNLINTHPASVYVLAAMTTLDGVNHKWMPASLVDSIYLAPYTTLKNDHSNALKFAGYISQSVQNRLLTGTPSDADKNWILFNNVWYGAAASAEIARNYFTMLILRDPGIGFKWTTSGSDTVPNVKPLALLRDKISGTQSLSNNLFQIIISVNKILDSRNVLLGNDNDHKTTFVMPGTVPKVELINRQQTFVLIESIFSIVHHSFALVPDNSFPDKVGLLLAIDRAQRALPLFSRVFDITDQLALKNYNEVIFSVGLLLKDALNAEGFYVPEAYFQYGNFLASVAIAKSGADVKAAIDAVALPSGSSSIKKDLAFNAALNGYVGYFARQLDDDERYYEGFTETHGITAPVGVTISHGLGRAGSLSVFLGILDVGAIVKYKVSEDPNEAPKPEIDWGNILSPGVHLVYGGPFYLPISVGIGQQWLPKNVEDTRLKFNGGLNLFIAFDIPIINLASSKRRSTYAINARGTRGTTVSK